MNTALMNFLLGADRQIRWRVIGVGLCTIVYLLSCTVAWCAAESGILRAWALPYLLLTIPLSFATMVLVRTGWSAQFSDPALTIPQNILALAAIALAYTATNPQDRGLVLVLLTLVMVFGMYTHTPHQMLVTGGGSMLLLGGTMYGLTRWDPVYYPATLELIRFELLAGCLPVLVYVAHQLVQWRERLRSQREDLAKALAVVQQLATRDTLTGLLNRRHMQDQLDEGVKRQQTQGETFAVALIDLDHFKAINDLHGHGVGDEVLIRFAQAAQAVLRETDTLARWGGEEFLILCLDTPPAQVREMLLRLQETLTHLPMSEPIASLRVTFSAGISLHGPQATLDQTLERADAALYEVKRTGRRQVLIAPCA